MHGTTIKKTRDYRSLVKSDIRCHIHETVVRTL